MVSAMTEVVPGGTDSGVQRPPPIAPGPVPPGYLPLNFAQAAPPPPPGQPPFTRSAAWRWLIYAVVGFIVGQIAAGIFGVVAGAVEGKTTAQMTAIARADVPPEWYIVSTLAGIWVGFVGFPWLASRTAGTKRFWRDLGVRFRLIDLPLGALIGLAGQFGISLLYAPFKHDIHNYDAPTQKITGGAHGTGVLVIVLVTAVLTPFVEELFFRGLLFRALLRLTASSAGWAGGVVSGRRRLIGVAAAVVIDGLLFGLAHAEWVQLAGLAIFGVVLATVAYRTGRLGMNMCAHASFNLVAVLVFLYGTHGGPV
jgi:membrane protease YdiL (CAAX protease family)